MMSSPRIFVLAVASTAFACGDLADLSEPATDAAPAEQALRVSDSTAAFSISGEEVSAVELAKFAQHRVTDPNFLAYVQAQQARHQALLDGLKQLANAQQWTVSTSMSQGGTQQWGALLQKSGPAFQQMYLRLQTPWQRQVINKLAQLQQGASSAELRAYASDARAAWEQDAQEARSLSSN